MLTPANRTATPTAMRLDTINDVFGRPAGAGTATAPPPAAGALDTINDVFGASMSGNIAPTQRGLPGQPSGFPQNTPMLGGATPPPVVNMPGFGTVPLPTATDLRNVNRVGTLLQAASVPRVEQGNPFADIARQAITDQLAGRPLGGPSPVLPLTPDPNPVPIQFEATVTPQQATVNTMQAFERGQSDALARQNLEAFRRQQAAERSIDQATLEGFMRETGVTDPQQAVRALGYLRANASTIGPQPEEGIGAGIVRRAGIVGGAAFNALPVVGRTPMSAQVRDDLGRPLDDSFAEQLPNVTGEILGSLALAGAGGVASAGSAAPALVRQMLPAMVAGVVGVGESTQQGFDTASALGATDTEATAAAVGTALVDQAFNALGVRATIAPAIERALKDEAAGMVRTFLLRKAGQAAEGAVIGAANEVGRTGVMANVTGNPDALDGLGGRAAMQAGLMGAAVPIAGLPFDAAGMARTVADRAAARQAAADRAQAEGFRQAGGEISRAMQTQRPETIPVTPTERSAEAAGGLGPVQVAPVPDATMPQRRRVDPTILPTPGERSAPAAASTSAPQPDAAGSAKQDQFVAAMGKPGEPPWVVEDTQTGQVVSGHRTMREAEEAAARANTQPAKTETPNRQAPLDSSTATEPASGQGTLNNSADTVAGMAPPDGAGPQLPSPNPPQGPDGELIAMARRVLAGEMSRKQAERSFGVGPNKDTDRAARFGQIFTALRDGQPIPAADTRTPLERTLAEVDQATRLREQRARVPAMLDEARTTLEQAGFRLEFESDSGSRYFRTPTGDLLRVSDHFVPDNNERVTRRANALEQGTRQTGWDSELVVMQRGDVPMSDADMRAELRRIIAENQPESDEVPAPSEAGRNRAGEPTRGAPAEPQSPPRGDRPDPPVLDSGERVVPVGDSGGAAQDVVGGAARPGEAAGAVDRGPGTGADRVVPAAAKPKRPRLNSLNAVRERALELIDADGAYDGLQSARDAMDNLAEDEMNIGRSLVFSGPLPLEIQEAIRAEPRLRMAFSANKPWRTATGEDTLASMGADWMIAEARRRLAGRNADRLRFAAENPDRNPEAHLLAWMVANWPKTGRPKLESAPSEGLRVGARFKILGEDFAVLDEDGQKWLARMRPSDDNPADLEPSNRIPLDAIPEVPFDRGTLKQGRGPKKAQSAPAVIIGDEVAPFMPKRPAKGPTSRAGSDVFGQNGLFGQGEVSRLTGSQGLLFGQPTPEPAKPAELNATEARRPGESEADYRLRLKSAEAERNTGRLWMRDPEASRTKTVTVDGKERPTVNADGKPIHPTVEGVQAFWRWFGDSKVVDEQGRPRVMYHGTNFKGDGKPDLTDTFSPNPYLGGAIFLSPDPAHAGLFANLRGGRVYPVYVKAENVGKKVWHAADEPTAGKRARARGQDGFRVSDQPGRDVENLAVFSPTQIKSATGNRGTFDSADPSILAMPRRAEPDPNQPRLFPEPPPPPEPAKRTARSVIDSIAEESIRNTRTPGARPPEPTGLPPDPPMPLMDGQQGIPNRTGSATSFDVRPSSQYDLDGPGIVEVRWQQIKDTMEAVTGTPIRFGQVRMPKTALGYFSPAKDVVRSKTRMRLNVLAHELGHALHTKFLRTKPDPKAEAELQKMGVALYGATPPANGYVSEGVAELIARDMMGEDIATTQPEAAKWLQKAKAEHLNARQQAQYDQTRTLIDRFDRQGAVARVKAHINTVDTSPLSAIKDGWAKFQRRGLVESLRAGLRWYRTNFFNEAASLEDAVQRLMADARKNGWTGDVPARMRPDLMRAALHSGASATARSFVLNGTTNLAGEVTGPSLRDALKGVMDRREDFTAYISAMRSEQLRQRGIQTGFSARDAQYTIAKMDSPEFRAAVQSVTEWNDRVLQYAVEAGALSPEVAAKIRELNPIYVPMQAEFSPDEIGGGGTGGSGEAQVGSVVKAIKGSDRAKIDPIEAMIAQAEHTIGTANKARVARAIVDFAEKVPGSAWFAERVATDQLKIEKRIGQFEDQFKEAFGADAWDRLMNDPDLNPQWQDEMLTFFENAWAPTGKEPVVVLVRNGERLWYQLDPEVYRLVTNMDREVLPLLLRWMQGPTNLLRLGATGANVSFAIANAIRDAMSYAIVGKFGVPGESLAGLPDVIGDTAAFRRYQALGVESSTLMGIERKEAARVSREVFDRHNLALRVAMHPIEALRNVTQVIESAPRVQEFKNVLRAELNKGADPESAAITAGLAAREVTLNFQRGGLIGRALNPITAFFNAMLQGKSKVFRALTRPGGAAVGRGVVWARALGWLTVPSLTLWMLNHDEEWYRELPVEDRMRFWHVRMGETVWRIPKPFDLGILFGSIPELVADELAGTTSRGQVAENVAQLLNMALPISMFTREGMNMAGLMAAAPDAVRPLIEAGFNYSTFRRGPIVPRREAENLLPAEQFGPAQTEIAKTAGELLGISPRKIEHLVSSYTGGFGMDALRLGNVFAPVTDENRRERERSLADVPIIGRFIQRDSLTPGGMSDSMDAFYRAADRYNRLANSRNATPLQKQIDRDLARVSRQIAELRTLGRKGNLRPDELRRLRRQQMDLAEQALRRIEGATP